jgi:hypothetical protein
MNSGISQRHSSTDQDIIMPIPLIIELLDPLFLYPFPVVLVDHNPISH